MSKYTKPVNVWNLNSEERKALQPGQWVYAGTPDSKGIWCGQKSNGVDVVAWYENAKRQKDFNEYVNKLMAYAAQ